MPTVIELTLSKTIQEQQYEPLTVELKATVGEHETIRSAFETLKMQAYDLLGLSTPEPVQSNEVTSKQLGMIRALARENNVDHDEECNSLMGCSTDELTKKTASELIKHLQNLKPKNDRAKRG